MKKQYYILKERISIFLIIVLFNCPLSGVVGQALVGSIPGEIDVSPTGAASYSIPIEIVPGTAGMQPNLSIVYNSQAGTGALGIKWDLAGLSSIRRVGQTMYFDNNVTAIKLNDTDRFALDDVRLLVTNDKVYGANDAEYGTEMVNFAKIRHYGTMGNGPAYFEVITDDGTRIEYGNVSNSPNSRMELNGTALTWMINKITDIHGNYMTFTYIKDDNVVPWIDKIEYTGNAAVNPVLSPYAEVSFTYQTNTATANTSLYIAGYEYKKTKRMETIRIKYDNDTVREYLFTYDQNENNRYNRLLKIDLQVGGNKVSDPTIITWGEENTEKITITQISDRYWGVYPTLAGDFNGDGIADIILYNIFDEQGQENYMCYIYYGDGYGGFSPRTQHIQFYYMQEVFAIDIDGDGKDDFLCRPESPKQGLDKVNLETFEKEQIIDTVENIIFGDFNGDGKTDILFSKPKRCYQTSPQPPYSDSYSCPETYLLTDINQTPKKVSYVFNSDDYYYTCDFNGDGKTNLASFSGCSFLNISEYDKTGENFTPLHIRSLPFPPAYEQKSCFSGDFNGDGISDILIYINKEKKWRLYLGTGAGDSLSAGAIPIANITGWSDIIIADFDGDGKDDIAQIVYNVGTVNTEIHFYLARNISLSACSFDKHSVPQQGWYPYGYSYIVGDINNDGKNDLLFQDLAYISLYKGEKTSLVTKITDGMGIENEFDYTYRKSYPVVSQLGQSNGLGTDKNLTFFNYKNPEFSLKRRSFLGFSEFVIEKDGFTAFYNFSKNNQYEILVLDTVIKRKTGRITVSIPAVSQRILTTQFLDFGNKRFLQYNSVVADLDMINNIFHYTERELYTSSGPSKGRDRLVISGYKSTASSTAPYELKSTKETSYMTYGLHNNDIRITRPDRVISKEIINGSPLEKTDTADYTYDYMYGYLSLTKVITKNAHGYRQKEYSNRDNYGIPQTVVETASGSANSIRKDYKYDTKGRFILHEIFQNTDTVKYTYHERTGNIESVTDINNLTISYQYDNSGRKIETTYPDGTIDNIAFVRGADSNISNSAYSIVVSSTGRATLHTFYDKLGRELVSGAAGLSFKETRYNCKGLVEMVSYPYETLTTPENQKTWQEYAYDEHGRIISEKGPYTDLCYTYAAKKVTVRDKLRDATRIKTVDAAARLKEVTDRSGATIDYSYALINSDGKVCSQTQISAFGNTTTIINDQWGNRISLLDPDAGEITGTYNGFGQLLTQTDANGTTTSYTYDKYGRDTLITMEKQGSQPTTISHKYDANGKKGTLSCETMQPDNTSITYTYDNLMRLTGKTYDIGNNQPLAYSFTYNNMGQVEDITYPFGFTIQQEYDSYGRLRSINRTDVQMPLYEVNSFSLSGMPSTTVSGETMGSISKYDITGRLFSRVTGKGNFSSGNFSVQDTGIQYQRYGYDNAGRMIERTIGNIWIMTNHNPLTVRRSHQTKDWFQYDKSDRLTNASGESVTGFFGVADGEPYYANVRYENKEYFNITYNQNLMTSNSAVGDYSYTATQPHALSQVDLLDENTVNIATCSTFYNLFNKLDSINEDGYAYKINYYPNKNQAVSTLEENGAVTSQKHYAGKAFEIDYATGEKYFYVYAYGQPVAVFIGDETEDLTPYYIYTDHLGSIDKITGSDGTIVNSMSFDAWGNRRRTFYDEYGSQIPDYSTVYLIDRGFTGHQHLDIFKLINMGGRVYDPVTAQFLSPDPYVQDPQNTQNMNRYAYCLYSPLMYTDPTGEQVTGYISQITDDFGILHRPGRIGGFSFIDENNWGWDDDWFDDGMGMGVFELWGFMGYSNGGSSGSNGGSGGGGKGKGGENASTSSTASPPPSSTQTSSNNNAKTGADMTGVQISANGFILLGAGVDITVGRVKGEGLFASLGIRFGVGADESISIGIIKGTYHGVGQPSSSQLAGTSGYVNGGVALYNYTYTRDAIMNPIWTTHTHGISIGTKTLIGGSAGFSATLPPLIF